MTPNHETKSPLARLAVMEFDVGPHEAYDAAISAVFVVAMLIVTVLIFVSCPDMDTEEHHDEVQREASAAGLLVGIFILFLLVVGACCFGPHSGLLST